MILETLYNNIIKDLDEYRQKYPEKTSQSADFIPTFKTRHSNNITLEDWNTLQQYVSNLNSDSTVQDEYLNSLTESLKSLITRLQEYDNNVVHKTGNELIGGQKVFSSGVKVPPPTEDRDAVNKKYLTDNFYNKNETYAKSETYSRNEALEIGLYQMTNYNEETGEIEITYNDGLFDVEYNSETGELMFIYR